MVVSCTQKDAEGQSTRPATRGEGEAMKQIFGTLIVIMVMGLVIYGAYHLTKTLSYRWWYEDMVKATIEQMVKPEALN